MGLLEKLIAKDFTVTGVGRWLKTTEHDSLVIDTDKQIFFWNSRSIFGTAFDWLTKVKGYSYQYAKDLLKEHADYEDTFIHNVRDKKEYVVYPKLVDVFYENGLQNDMEYWDKRGISLETVHRFKLGYTGEFYTIPVYQDGLFRNFQLRKDIPEKTIRYYYRGGKPWLFNSDILKITSSIVIAEGPTDCLRLMQEGVPCISHTGGSEWWDNDWFRYFIHQREVFVCYDNDFAGQNGAKKVAKNLGLYKTKIYTFDGFGPKYDIVDFFNDGYTKKDFMNLLDENAKMSFEIA